MCDLGTDIENVKLADELMPNRKVAGHATATGNAIYRAFQRSTNLVSIGLMLQGMGKPVNDLSHGALVDDIVFTKALKAIQATP